MEVLLPKNSKIPLSMTKYFTTYTDDQEGITVEVYEGEHEIAKDNTHICYFNFVLPKHQRGPAGAIQHPVTLLMNRNGVLQVRAGVHHELNEEPLNFKWMVLLCIYIVFLFGVYVVGRIYLRPDN